MTITSTFVRTVRKDSDAEQRLWKLSEPVKTGWNGNALTEFVVTSAVDRFGPPETYIFPSDADGKITDWLEMTGSYKGGLDHERAIRGAGWEIVP